MTKKQFFRIVAMLTCLAALASLHFQVFGQDIRTYIHPRAVGLMPTVQDEFELNTPGVYNPAYVLALFEHESCITLRHSRCLSPAAELKNNREHGVGLSQITRAWDKNGRLRFDNLDFYRKKYPDQLWELSWDNVKQRPDLQIRLTMLMMRDVARPYHSEVGLSKRAVVQFTDSVWNGGKSHLDRARQICKVTTNCNPRLWDNNVELYLPKSKTPDSRYGGRSLYQINVHHVSDVFKRIDKFYPYYPEYPRIR